MIRFFRTLSESWPARIFFGLLALAFVGWGIGGGLRSGGGGDAVATVGGQSIDASEFQDAFRREMQQVARSMGRTEPTPALRRSVAQQTLDQLITRDSLAEEVARLGLVVPDDVLRQVVMQAPAFAGPGGQFDRAAFDNALRNNDMTEARFFDLSRGELAQQELLGAALAGVTVPPELRDQLFIFQAQTRAGEIVELPFSAAAAPPAPTADDLQRQYENNPESYSAPEYRRIKVVVLAPAILARGIDVSDADARAYYDQHPAEFHVEGKRAAEVIATADEATAKQLAAAWQAGADWSQMQKQADAAKASAITLAPSAPGEIPSPVLAKAIFAAAPDTVTGPIQDALAWQVFRVTGVVGAVARSFEAAEADIKAKIAQDRALDEVFTRANKLDDALSAGTSLDEMPPDLGLAGLTGTLDAQGNTPDGEPAPLPGDDALRQAIVRTAFQTQKGEPPRMVEGPGSAYYALQVEDVTPAKVKSFDAVKAQVSEDWEAAQRRHEQDAAAAKLMIAAKAGGSLDDAATIAGLRISKTPPVTRTEPSDAVPLQIQQALFSLQPGDTTMVETGDGFVVVRLTDVHDPDPTEDPAATAKLQEDLSRDLQRDVLISLATALRNRAQPQVNPTLLNSLTQ